MEYSQDQQRVAQGGGGLFDAKRGKEEKKPGERSKTFRRWNLEMWEKKDVAEGKRV